MVFRLEGNSCERSIISEGSLTQCVLQCALQGVLAPKTIQHPSMQLLPSQHLEHTHLPPLHQELLRVQHFPSHPLGLFERRSRRSLALGVMTALAGLVGTGTGVSLPFRIDPEIRNLEGTVLQLGKLQIREEVFYLSTVIASFVSGLEAGEEAEQQLEVADHMQVGSLAAPRITFQNQQLLLLQWLVFQLAGRVGRPVTRQNSDEV